MFHVPLIEGVGGGIKHGSKQAKSLRIKRKFITIQAMEKIITTPLSPASGGHKRVDS